MTSRCTGLKRRRWHRDGMVRGSRCGRDETRTKTFVGEGSSRVLRSELAEVMFMRSASSMITTRLAPSRGRKRILSCNPLMSATLMNWPSGSMMRISGWLPLSIFRQEVQASQASAPPFSQLRALAKTRAVVRLPMPSAP